MASGLRDTLVRCGDYRQRITIRLPQEVQTETGGFEVSYLLIASRIPAKVSPTSGRRLVSGQQVDARTSYEIRLRYRDDLTARHQVIYHAPGGDKVLDVLSVVDPEERHAQLDLTATENAT